MTTLQYINKEYMNEREYQLEDLINDFDIQVEKCTFNFNWNYKDKIEKFNGFNSWKLKIKNRGIYVYR